MPGKSRTVSDTSTMPEPYRGHWEQVGRLIAERIAEFGAVEPHEYHYEMLYCLLTPQSRALHAGIVVDKLRAAGWPERSIDPVPILRDPAHYIRFHNVKGARLLRLRAMRNEVQELLQSPLDSQALRDALVAKIDGFGMKEASHFLRNIGRLDLAIIDRHILKHLFAAGAIDTIPKSMTPKRYRTVEAVFDEFV